MKIIKENGLTFELNETDFTAKIINSSSIKGPLIIPRSIRYQSCDYIIINIGEKSFKDNNCISIIQFPDDSKLLSISKKAFYYSSLQQLTIPSSVENLETGWCKGTSELISISVSSQNRNFSLFNNQFILGKTIKDSDNYDILLFSCRNIKKAVIPSNIKKIGPYCFSECNGLLTIEFSENSELTKIEKYAFNETGIKTVYIPPHVTSIGKCAFSWCDKLQSIQFSKQSELRTIEKGAFSYSGLLNISLPPKVTQICEKTFAFCRKLKSIEIPENSEIISIDNYAFASTLIESIFIPAKLRELREGWCGVTSHLNQFSIDPLNCHFLSHEEKFILGKSDEKSDIFDLLFFAVRNVEQVSIPSSIRTIRSFAFSECNKLQTIEFSKNSELEFIEENAFHSSSIQNILIPPKVKEIKEETFSKCTKLKAIEFSEDSEIKVIKNEAFSWSSIEKIFFPPNLEELQEGWCCGTSKLTDISISPLNNRFLNFQNQFVLKKLNEKSDNYNEIIFARRDIERAVIPSNIEQISSFSFFECKNLQAVEFSENSILTKIERDAFSTSSITTIRIPPHVREIGQGVFTFCTKLKYIEFSDDSELESIGKEAFFETAIQKVSIPKKVKKIGENAFQYCSELKLAEFLSNDVSIGKRCFNGCTGILLFSFPNAQTVTVNQDSFSYNLLDFSLFIKPRANLVNNSNERSYKVIRLK